LLIVIFERKKERKRSLEKDKKKKICFLSHFLNMILVIFDISFDEKSLIMMWLFFLNIFEKEDWDLFREF